MNSLRQRGCEVIVDRERERERQNTKPGQKPRIEDSVKIPTTVYISSSVHRNVVKKNNFNDRNGSFQHLNVLERSHGLSFI